MPSKGDVFCRNREPHRFPSTQQKVCNRIHVRALAVPNTEADVAYIVKYVAAHNMTLSYIGAGHSYTCASSITGSLQMSMRNFDSIVFDPEQLRVTVGAGVAFHEVLNVVDNNKYTVSHGECDSVGVAGYTLHGGMNPGVTRLAGTGNTTIVALRLVDADGNLQSLDASSADQDLWQAMRLAGSAFGVVTQFTLKVVKEPEPYKVAFLARLNADEYASIIRKGFDTTWSKDVSTAMMTFDRSGPIRALPFAENDADFSLYNFYFSVRRSGWMTTEVSRTMVLAAMLHMLPIVRWYSITPVLDAFDDWGYATFVASDEVISVWNCFQMTCDTERIAKLLAEHFREYAYSDATRFCWLNLFAPSGFEDKMCFQYTCPDLPNFNRELQKLDEELIGVCPEYTRYYNMGVYWDANASSYLTHNYGTLAALKKERDPLEILNNLGGVSTKY
jgi:hypothetical protein